MSHLAKLSKRFCDDEAGAALVEYAVIFAVLIAGTVTAFGLIAPQLDRIFQLVTDILVAVV